MHACVRVTNERVISLEGTTASKVHQRFALHQAQLKLRSFVAADET